MLGFLGLTSQGYGWMSAKAPTQGPSYSICCWRSVELYPGFPPLEDEDAEAESRHYSTFSGCSRSKKKSGGLLSAVLTLLTLASALTTSLPKSPSCEKSHQGQTPEETSDLLAYGRVQQSYPTISPHTPKKRKAARRTGHSYWLLPEPTRP